MSSIERTRKAQVTGTRFALSWALATCLGGTLGYAAAYAFVFWQHTGAFGSFEEARRIELVGTNAPAVIVTIGFYSLLPFGFFVGLAQAALLKQFEQPGETLRLKWVIASVVGWTFIGLYILPLGFFGLYYFTSCATGLVVVILVSGGVLSLIQWAALRNHYDKDPGMRTFWAMVGVAGIALGLFVSAAVFGLLYVAGIGTYVFEIGYGLASTSAAASGLFAYGLVTGAALGQFEQRKATIYAGIDTHGASR